MVTHCSYSTCAFKLTRYVVAGSLKSGARLQMLECMRLPMQVTCALAVCVIMACMPATILNAAEDSR